MDQRNQTDLLRVNTEEQESKVMIVQDTSNNNLGITGLNILSYQFLLARSVIWVDFTNYLLTIVVLVDLHSFCAPIKEGMAIKLGINYSCVIY